MLIVELGCTVLLTYGEFAFELSKLGILGAI